MNPEGCQAARLAANDLLLGTAALSSQIIGLDWIHLVLTNHEQQDPDGHLPVTLNAPNAGQDFVVYYNSFRGRVSDSPLALFRALRDSVPLDSGLTIKHIWAVSRGTSVPDDVRGPSIAFVDAGSAAEEEAFRQADLIIGNTYLPFEKRNGAVFLQTWHGVGPKPIAFHNSAAVSRPTHDRHLEDWVGAWDYLVTPCNFAARVYPDAFRFTGTVITAGYPRNDVLLSKDAPAIRRQVRAGLGVSDDTKVVMYAPTFRDDVVAPGGRQLQEVQVGLDLKQMSEVLGSDHMGCKRRTKTVARAGRKQKQLVGS